MLNIPNYLEEWTPGPNQSPWHLIQDIKASLTEQLRPFRRDNPDSLEVLTPVHSAGENREWLLIELQVYDGYNWGEYHRICGVFVPLNRPRGKECWPVRYREGTVRPWDVSQAEEEFATDEELIKRIQSTLEQWMRWAGNRLERD